MEQVTGCPEHTYIYGEVYPVGIPLSFHVSQMATLASNEMFRNARFNTIHNSTITQVNGDYHQQTSYNTYVSPEIRRQEGM